MLPNADARLASLIAARNQRWQREADPITFVDETFDQYFTLSSGIHLIGAQSGHGKSTCVANVLLKFLETSQRSALVLSTEETIESVHYRVAALQRGEAWRGLGRESAEVRVHAHKLTRHLIVPEGMHNLDKVKDILRVARNSSEIGLVIIDYWQGITPMIHEPTDRYERLKLAGDFLTDYAKQTSAPILVFAQLRSARGGKDFQERLQFDTTVYNHASTALELKKQLGRSEFIFHKLRNAGELAEMSVTMNFSEGRFSKSGAARRTTSRRDAADTIDNLFEFGAEYSESAAAVQTVMKSKHISTQAYRAHKRRWERERNVRFVGGTRRAPAARYEGIRVKRSKGVSADIAGIDSHLPGSEPAPMPAE